MRDFVRWYRLEESETDLEIRGIGIDEEMRVPEIDRPSGTGDILLMFFSSPMTCGTPELISKTAAPSVILWEKNMGHYYHSENLPWRHTWIHIKGRNAEKICAHLNLTPGIPHSCSYNAPLTFFQQLAEQMSRPEKDYRIIEALLKTAFLIISQKSGTNQSLKVVIAEKVHNYLEENYHRKITLDKLSKTFKCSTSTLCSTYKKHFDTTITADLRAIRMHIAEIHLHNRNHTIGEIASLVGVEDIYSFSKQFKREKGMSPRKKRNLIFNIRK